MQFLTDRSILSPFKEGLWKRTCVRVAIRFFKKHFFFKKKRFCFCFLRLVGFCNGYLNTSLDLDPVWEARFCTVLSGNSFAKIFGICLISQRRYSSFLGSLRQSVLRYPLQNRELMKIKVFARKGCKSWRNCFWGGSGGEPEESLGRGGQGRGVK